VPDNDKPNNEPSLPSNSKGNQWKALLAFSTISKKHLVQSLQPHLDLEVFDKQHSKACPNSNCKLKKKLFHLLSLKGVIACRYALYQTCKTNIIIKLWHLKQYETKNNMIIFTLHIVY